MNALAQNFGPWYQNEGPTVEEMKKEIKEKFMDTGQYSTCLLYTSPSPRD